MKLTAIVEKEGNWYTAWCPDVDIASQGKTVDEALESLKEALELYLEDEDAQVPSKETKIAIVPLHDELTPGTLLSVIRQSGLTKEEFIRLIK